MESMTGSDAMAREAYDASQDRSDSPHRDITMPKEEDVGNGSDQNDQTRGIIVNAEDMTTESAPKKKKKKSRKPASKRGLGKPTGFEENYADAPLRPEEVAEQRERYSLDIPFIDRVLTAIQHFERTRKLTPERRDIFYKYLMYGGIEVGPNMFQGQMDTEDMDKEELASTMARANISDATKASLEEKHSVDFLTTMKAFLSRRAPVAYTFDTRDQVNLITTTVERFMDYLLQHDVCPEYGEEVLSTRNFCRVASAELWDCAEAQRWLPGDFNMACSTLFGGSYGRMYDGKTYWGDPKPGENVFVGLTAEMATQIVGFAIAGAASEDVYDRYHEIYNEQEGTFEIVNTIRDHGFEIINIEQPTEECKELYKANTSDYRPVGQVHAKFWANPEAPPEDLTPEEQVMINNGNTESDFDIKTVYTFFVESPTIIDLLKVGQKIEATIHELSCGVWFFDEVLRVYPSFDIWIENEMMMGWKEPKALKGSLGFEDTNAKIEEGHNGTRNVVDEGDTGATEQRDVVSKTMHENLTESMSDLGGQ